MARLELAQVSKSFDGKRVLEPIDLAVADGTVCCMLGSSGSGKSTLLRIIAGLLPGDGGRVVVGGTDVTGSPSNKRNIGLVFQNYALFPHMSVADNVAFGLRMRRVGRRAAMPKVLDMLGLVGLRDLADRRPAQCSGGQQQRVALARALVVEPDLLLLDEPLSALDRKIRGEMQAELKRIHRETGLTTVMVTHDQEEAMDLGDQVLLLEQGRVQQIGEPTDLYRRPANSFVAGFLGADPLPAGKVVESGQGLAVSVNGVVLPLPAETGLRPDEVVDVALQPESVTLAPRTDGSTGLCGTLVSLSFYGTLIRARVDVDGLDLPVAMLSAADHGLEVGRPVQVTINPAGVHAFSRDVLIP
jgi:ABC-type Fe3+/spermidine/putrescine transport system ATPase subunit